MTLEHQHAAGSTANRLLNALAVSDRETILPLLESVDLALKEVLETPNVPIEHVYFIQQGLVSIVGTTGPRHRIEVAMIGHEGMTGLSVVLGGDRSPNEALVQTPGTALRISVQSLRGVLSDCPGIASKLQQYVQVFMSQASCTAIANGRGKLNERLARWLLMWHDRLSGDLPVTQEFLSLLLGVRRPGVTTAMHYLEGEGLIRSSRNKVRILDRAGLKRLAGEFYGIPEREYDRLFPSSRSAQAEE